MVFRCSVRARYDAALYIPGAGGGSSRTHGHGYTVEAVLEADELDRTGFVVDFEVLQPELTRIAAELDHRLLNDLEPFSGASPSAERQALYFYTRLTDAVGSLFEGRVRLARIRITQEPDAWVEYEP
jgi:6-pyruvoyltetrahydropterin/6-carboxytetrahydropterin synthase